MPRKKDWILKGKKILHAQTHGVVGIVQKDGSCVGKHPWNDTDIIVAPDPEKLRRAQRQLAAD